MARKANESSIRQQAFARLDQLTDKGRKEAAEILMSEFNIGQSYAMTIYQQHRNEAKKSGAFVAVYSVRDTKEGELTIVTSHVRNANASDATTPEAAVESYVTALNAKVAAARAIDVTSFIKPEPVAETVTSVVKTGDVVKPGDAAPAEVPATEVMTTDDKPWKVLGTDGEIVSEHTSRSKARAAKAEGQTVKKL